MAKRKKGKARKKKDSRQPGWTEQAALKELWRNNVEAASLERDTCSLIEECEEEVREAFTCWWLDHVASTSTDPDTYARILKMIYHAWPHSKMADLHQLFRIARESICRTSVFSESLTLEEREHLQQMEYVTTFILVNDKWPDVHRE